MINRTLSDQEIYTAWNKGGAIAYVAELSGTPVQKLEQLGAAASAQPYRSFPSGWRP